METTIVTSNVFHPLQEIFTNLVDEEKLILSEAAANPVLLKILNQYTQAYQLQQSEISVSLSAEEMKHSYVRLSDAQGTVKSITDLLAEVMNWSMNLQR